ALYTTEVKYGGYINTAGAIHHADKWVSPIDDIGSYEPDIACQFLDEMYVVWNNDVGGGYTKAQIRFQYSDDYGDSWGNHGAASDIVGYDPNYRHSNPRIKSLNDQPVVLCSLQYVATSSWYVGRYHFNAGWLPNNPNDAKIATTNTVRPYPCVNGQKGLYERYFYRNSDGKLEHRTSTGGVTSDFLGDTQIYGGSSTANYSIDCKTHHDGAGTVVGAAVADDGKIYFRHTDGTAPTGSITKPAGADVYYNSDFEVTASATDDFCYTGADVATAVQYYNGIEKVTYYYQEEGGAWHDLPCDGGNVATVPPYKRTALADSLDGKRFKIRGLATDSAGNEGAFISSNWITVDMDPPETTIAVSGKAGDNGYYRSQVSVTLAVSDPTTEKTEYRLTNTAAGAAGAGNWTTYSKPFVFADGKWKVEFYSEDRAGNREVAKTKSLKVDTVAPVCAVTSPSKDTIQTGYTTDEKAEISGFATDSEGMARMKILMDGELITETERNFAGLAYFWPLAGQENKTHEIKVEGTDVAGNRGTSVKRVWVGNVASTWFFPEGNTLPEFRQFICLYNPGDTPVQVRLTFMCEDGQVFTTERAMNPQQRDTVFVKDVVPEGHVGVATQVDALDPEKAIAAECPMYFVYKNKWKGGHNVFGMNTLQQEYYFAEGTTRNNETDGEFEEWICIMNPGDTPASVVVTYMLGTGLNLDKAYRVEPHSRATVEVAADVGLDQDVSAKVTSDSPIAATRPMYFNYHGWAVDGSAVVGASGPQLAWELAEGCTRRGYQQWLTIQNPNDVDATCDITYMTSGGQVVEAREVVPGRTRATIEVATQVGDDVDVSTT
ncbi:MAG: hypothetical protein KKE56_06840, partial [Actinobacteria bacterium]|nr:hypothetical protein [Actinomycetota bacterium]